MRRNLEWTNPPKAGCAKGPSQDASMSTSAETMSVSTFGEARKIRATFVWG
jgi:hypothetical protein